LRYWPDADVFIQSKNKMYKFGQVPQFWAFISAQLESGTIKVPKMVYDELAVGVDEYSGSVDSDKKGARFKVDRNHHEKALLSSFQSQTCS
jgi:hypothetical protein